MTEVTPALVAQMAAAAGLPAPSEVLPGVTNRLAAMNAATRLARRVVPASVAPFTKFSFTRPASMPPTPPDMPAGGHDLAHISTAIRSGRLSPIQLTEWYLQRIEELSPELVAYITVSADRARQDAHRASEEIARGYWFSPLHGVPIAHKDLISTRGIRTTLHTHAHKDCVPDHDDPVVTRLAAAGTVLLGKLNTLELGSGEGDVFGLARNPWNPLRQVGGSSSGSAVAVAAGLTAAATGTDAGGSIRIPAAFCGIVGLKPTAGLMPEAQGISVPGPMTRTVRDAALMLEAMTGASGYTTSLVDGVAGMRIGVPVDWIDVPIEPEVNNAFRQAIEVLAADGAVISEVRLPAAAMSEQLGALITHVECFGKYRYLLEQGAQLGGFIHELLLAAELYSASDYRLAQKARQLLVQEVDAVHAQVDLMITPMLPYRAALVGQTELDVNGTVINPRLGQGRFTRLSNLTGLPSLSVPAGLDSNGMPLAVQLLGRAFEEAVLLQAASVLEHHFPTLYCGMYRSPLELIQENE